MRTKIQLRSTHIGIQLFPEFKIIFKNPFNLMKLWEPLDSFQSSLEEKTPVAKIMSLQTTPLYGLCVYPVGSSDQQGKIKREKKTLLLQTIYIIKDNFICAL